VTGDGFVASGNAAMPSTLLNAGSTRQQWQFTRNSVN
jgi:hypothetical protein